MPLGYTEITVANLALRFLGEENITSFTDERQAARVMEQQFAISRDLELYNFPWPFALRRDQLTRIAPGAGYTSYGSAFDLAGLTKLIRIHEPTYDGNAWGEPIGWLVENDTLYTIPTIQELNVRYTEQVIEPNEWSIHFVNVVSLRLALRASDDLKASAQKVQEISSRYEQAYSDARRYESQTSRTPTPVDADDWLRSRYEGSF